MRRTPIPLAETQKNDARLGIPERCVQHARILSDKASSTL